MTDRNDDPRFPASESERVLHGTQTAQERVLHAAEGERTLRAAEAQHTLKGSETLYLYEERARVDVSVESQGQVTLQKKIVEQQEMIPVTIRREILEIVTAPGTGGLQLEGITLDGQPLEAGRSYEIVLTEERAHISKQVYPVQQISVRKRQISEQHSEAVTLRREVLEVDGPAELIHDSSVDRSSEPR